MKLAYAIGFVMLDGKPHPLEEIVSRVRHFVQPERALRQYAHRIKSRRRNSGLDIQRLTQNKTGKVYPNRRKEIPREEELKVDDALNYVVGATLQGMKQQGVLSNGDGSYQISPEGRQWVRGRMIAANIAFVIKTNLMLRGDLF